MFGSELDEKRSRWAVKKLLRITRRGRAAPIFVCAWRFSIAGMGHQVVRPNAVSASGDGDCSPSGVLLLRFRDWDSGRWGAFPRRLPHTGRKTTMPDQRLHDRLRDTGGTDDAGWAPRQSSFLRRRLPSVMLLVLDC